MSPTSGKCVRGAEVIHGTAVAIPLEWPKEVV